MTLHFTLTEQDALAFSWKYLRDSKSHQRIRTRTRWIFPLILLPLVGFDLWSGGFSGSVVVFGSLALAWWLFYPHRFDSRVRSHMIKQMRESGYERNFGGHELQLLDNQLVSTSPTGSSSWKWSAVDRVAIDMEYLYIFLSGPLGYVIRLSEIGPEAVRSAYDFISSHIAENKAPEAPSLK